MKRILSKTRKAVQDFDMIQDGDRIAVGLSGGKDSLLLLLALNSLKRFYPKKFEVIAITLTMGIGEFDATKLIKLCRDIDVEYHIIPTDIGKIVFDIKKEKNPCALCANMRRGALHNAALEYECKKVALGHHKDDAIETLLLSMLYEGRMHTFSPVTYLDRKKITVIRPLIYIEEKEIKGHIKKYDLPIVPSPCPKCGDTKREYVKNLIKNLGEDIPCIQDRLFTCITNTEQNGLWMKNNL